MMRCTIILFVLVFFSLNLPAQNEKQKEAYAQDIFKNFVDGKLNLIQDRFIDDPLLQKIFMAFEGKEELSAKELVQLKKERKQAETELRSSLDRLYAQLNRDKLLHKARFTEAVIKKPPFMDKVSFEIFDMQILFELEGTDYALRFGLNHYDADANKFYILDDKVRLTKGTFEEEEYNFAEMEADAESIRNEMDKPLAPDTMYETNEPIIKERVIMIPEKRLDDNQRVFISVQQSPEFPGGEDALYVWLKQNVSFPQEAKANGISGMVYIEFVVNQDGSLSDIKILREIGGGCGDAAVKAIQKMPKWRPGMNNGHTVRTRFTLPVPFDAEE